MIKLYYTFSNPDSNAFINACLKNYTGREAFEIKRTESGKPYTDGVEFSLSHTNGLTVCGVSLDAVGIDCEKIRSINNKERILARFTGKKEESVSNIDFLKKWTAFESCVKYYGEKITDCPSVFKNSIFTQTFELEEFVISVSSEQKTEIVKEILYDSF